MYAALTLFVHYLVQKILPQQQQQSFKRQGQKVSKAALISPLRIYTSRVFLFFQGKDKLRFSNLLFLIFFGAFPENRSAFFGFVFVDFLVEKLFIFLGNDSLLVLFWNFHTFSFFDFLKFVCIFWKMPVSGQPRGLFPVGQAWNATLGRDPGDI